MFYYFYLLWHANQKAKKKPRLFAQRLPVRAGYQLRIKDPGPLCVGPTSGTLAENYRM